MLVFIKVKISYNHTSLVILKSNNEMMSTLISIKTNPIKNEINVFAEKPLQSIVLLDSFGRIVIQKEVLNLQETTINVSQLSSGTYFLKVQVNNSTFIEKSYQIVKL